MSKIIKKFKAFEEISFDLAKDAYSKASNDSKFKQADRISKEYLKTKGFDVFGDNLESVVFQPNDEIVFKFKENTIESNLFIPKDTIDTWKFDKRNEGEFPKYLSSFGINYRDGIYTFVTVKNGHKTEHFKTDKTLLSRKFANKLFFQLKNAFPNVIGKYNLKDLFRLEEDFLVEKLDDIKKELKKDYLVSDKIEEYYKLFKLAKSTTGGNSIIEYEKCLKDMKISPDIEHALSVYDNFKDFIRYIRNRKNGDILFPKEITSKFDEKENKHKK